MVEYSIECLKSLAAEKVLVDELSDNGVVETLLKVRANSQFALRGHLTDRLVCSLWQVLKLNPYNRGIASSINQTLFLFCKSEQIAHEIGKCMGGAIFVNSLKKYTDPEMLLNTCKLVAVTAVDDVVGDYAQAGTRIRIRLLPERESSRG